MVTLFCCFIIIETPQALFHLCYNVPCLSLYASCNKKFKQKLENCPRGKKKNNCKNGIKLPFDWLSLGLSQGHRQIAPSQLIRLPVFDVRLTEY